MAGIRKTLCGTYEVYGYRLQADGNKQRFSKTFKTRAEAKRFAAAPKNALLRLLWPR
jgi:hypothetical protein